MFVTVIAAKNYSIALKQIKKAIHTDIFELRLDYFTFLDLEKIKLLRNSCSKPVIFTLRKKEQGGHYQGNEQQRLQDLISLCTLNPDFFDLEYDTPLEFVQSLQESYPEIKWIRSYHNFNGTPLNLHGILASLQNPIFDSYKIATFAHSIIDSLRMLCFIQENAGSINLSGLCMGEKGTCTRILGKIIGSYMVYASIDEQSTAAPGQICFDELKNIYYSNPFITKECSIYALLGDPINLSVGHIIHNKTMQHLKQDAIYLKLDITQQELSEAWFYFKKLPFKGFSITMPHKEAILPILDKTELSAFNIQAVNTVIKKKDKFIGCNTDGLGAIKSLTKRINIKNQKIIILGAGGAARAIAFQAIQDKADVIIVNRTLSKAKLLADQLGCEYSSFINHDFNNSTSYKVVINTLPSFIYNTEPLILSWVQQILKPDIIAMDIVYQPFLTPFVQIAQKASSECILGFEMYIHQALAQIDLWFSPTVAERVELQNLMEQYFTALLNKEEMI